MVNHIPKAVHFHEKHPEVIIEIESSIIHYLNPLQLDADTAQRINVRKIQSDPSPKWTHTAIQTSMDHSRQMLLSILLRSSKRTLYPTPTPYFVRQFAQEADYHTTTYCPTNEFTWFTVQYIPYPDNRIPAYSPGINCYNIYLYEHNTSCSNLQTDGEQLFDSFLSDCIP